MYCLLLLFVVVVYVLFVVIVVVYILFVVVVYVLFVVVVYFVFYYYFQTLETSTPSDDEFDCSVAQLPDNLAKTRCSKHLPRKEITCNS